MIKKFGIITLSLVLLSIVIGLVIMAFFGYYNRYWSDDWCYERDLEHLGVPQTLNGYFFTGEDAIRGYSTNRYGLTAITAFLYIFGLAGTQLLPALIITCLVGLLYLIISISPVRLDMHWTVKLLIATFFTYFLLFFSTHRFQILYWRAGVHYSGTIIVTLVLLGLILYYSSRQQSSRWIYVTAVLPALVGGGLSEIGCVYMLTAFALLWIAAFYFRKQGKAWALQAFPLVSFVVGLLLISMLALILSPSNDRYRVHTDNPIPFYLIPLKAPEFALAFIADSIKSLPLPHLVLALFFLILPSLADIDLVAWTMSSKTRIATGIFLTLGIAFILITAIQMPTTYFYGTQPDARAQSLSRFTIFICIAVVFFILGSVLIPARNTFALALCSLVMIGIGYYTLRMTAINLTGYPGFVLRSQAWDERDAMIRNAVAEGQSNLEVPVIDTHEIDTRDLIRSIDTDEWVSNCATEYYGAEAFLAIPP